VGEDVYPSFGGGRIEQQENSNSQSNGALIFDGFQWMGGHNNQLRVGLSHGICLGERECRTLTMRVDSVASFLLSN
jgi:hypothetical protein